MCLECQLCVPIADIACPLPPPAILHPSDEVRKALSDQTHIEPRLHEPALLERRGAGFRHLVIRGRDRRAGHADGADDLAARDDRNAAADRHHPFEAEEEIIGLDPVLERLVGALNRAEVWALRCARWIWAYELPSIRSK